MADHALADALAQVRQTTEALVAGLSAEDCMVQSMPDASPVKWHLAHTSWFFEQFILRPRGAGPFDAAFGALFNSYYVGAGRRHTRERRGDLSRPLLARVMAYRAHVTAAMDRLLRAAAPDAALTALTRLGLAHEQQHQELILTDMKHHFWVQPLSPLWQPLRQPLAGDAAASGPASAPPLAYGAIDGGLVEIGHAGAGFAFDNESPRHRVWLAPFALAERLVTETEYLAFIEDGGYQTPGLWLSDGWAMREQQGWQAPLYWTPEDAREGGAWCVHTWAGWRPLRADVPVCHLSHYEADAYARWAGARLPTEAEWEHATQRRQAAGGWPLGAALDDGHWHPAPSGARCLRGDCWEWTASSYLPYPGYRVPEGTVGEYNGKFMSGQMVLKGASAATPAGHARPSYRNFFPPGTRWQFSGLRLARDG